MSDEEKSAVAIYLEKEKQLEGEEGEMNIDRKMEKAKELQLKVMDVFEKEHIEQLHVYAILKDLVDTIKKYLLEKEDLDIDKMIAER